MGKYLELFRGEVGDLTEKTKLENKPYVAYSTKLGKVTYTVVPKPVVSGPWVTFTAEEANSTIGLNVKSSYQTLEYSTDKTTWSNMDWYTTITLANVGDEVYIRGMLIGNNDDWDKYTQFEMSGKISASGNCNAIWNYQELNAPLKAFCGFNMFGGCTSLTTAPELPATELAEGCYENMFQGCTSLTTAPELPVTELPERCYRYMFRGCNNLNYIACLATDTSASGCIDYWVSGVSSTGTFVKHPSMNDWTTDGDDGIPSGWTVVDAEV